MELIGDMLRTRQKQGLSNVAKDKHLKTVKEKRFDNRQLMTLAQMKNEILQAYKTTEKAPIDFVQEYIEKLSKALFDKTR